MPTTPAQCLNYDVNSKQCPCPNATCERHGICCECVSYHMSKGNASNCMRGTPRPAETKSLPIGRHKNCANRARNEDFCPCSETSCARHGICCDCVRFHWAHPQWPATACTP